MSTIKQIQANRANALRSTGPRTEAGKAASSGNALRHGLTARRVVIEGEDPVLFDRLRDEICAEFAPRGATEELLVEQLASTLWRLRRVPLLEAGLLDWIAHQERAKHDTPSAFDLPFQDNPRFLQYPRGGDRNASECGTDEVHRLGRMIETALERGDLLSKLSRYETQLMKQLARTFEQLRKLAEQRLQIEAVSEEVISEDV